MHAVLGASCLVELAFIQNDNNHFTCRKLSYKCEAFIMLNIEMSPR